MTGSPGSRGPGALAADALIAACAGQRARSAQAIGELAAAGALTRAMYRWVDTLIEMSRANGCPVPGPPSPGPLPRDRQAAAAGSDPAGELWAGQFISARTGTDCGACDGLVAAIPAGRAERYACCLVEAVCSRLRMLPVAGLDLWD